MFDEVAHEAELLQKLETEEDGDLSEDHGQDDEESEHLNPLGVRFIQSLQCGWTKKNITKTSPCQARLVEKQRLFISILPATS